MSNVDIEPITLERILEKENLQTAFKSVVSNKGAAGVDNMRTTELKQYFIEHPFEISRNVLEGKYRLQPKNLIAEGWIWLEECLKDGSMNPAIY